jgi:hypothetical protein
MPNKFYIGTCVKLCSGEVIQVCLHSQNFGLLNFTKNNKIYILYSTVKICYLQNTENNFTILLWIDSYIQTYISYLKKCINNLHGLLTEVLMILYHSPYFKWLNMPNKFYIGTCVKLCSIFSTCLKVSTTMILLTLKLPGILLKSAICRTLKIILLFYYGLTLIYKYILGIIN